MTQQIEDLTLIKFLGKGSFGEVYLSKKQNSNKLFATKKVDKKRVDTKMKRYFNYEIKILKFLDHPNIVKLEEVKMTQNNYYIVMEYINGGELSKILKKYQMRYQMAFPEQIVQYLMKQIVDALVYIHTRDIIHRDLKLENIMVSFDSERDKEELNMMKAKIKIIDFGFAIMLPSKKALTNTAVGTMLYMDPIILEEFYNKAKGDKNRGYGKEVDIWSLGCICYELFTGKYPFEANNLQSLVGKINQGSYRLPSSASSQIASFISNMLRYDGKSRLTAEELSAHPFLTYDVRNFKNIQANQDLKTKKYKGDIKDSIELYKEKKEKEILRNYINNNNSIGAKPIKEEDNISQIKNPKGIYKRTNTYSGTLSFYGQPMTLAPKPQMQNGAFQMPMNQFNMNGLQPHFQQINYGGAHPFGTFMNQNQIQNFQNQKTHY